MLETIFGALNDALVGLADIFLKWTNDILGLNTRAFVNHFPILASGYKLFQTLSIGIVILIAMYSTWKFFFGPTTMNATRNMESPTRIVVRTLGAIAMVFMGGHIFEYAMDLASIPYQAFLQLGDGGVRETGEIFSTAIGVGSSALLGSVTGGASTLMELILSLILLIALFKALFRLVMELLERYILVGILTFASPLASSTLASMSTSTIFSRFLNMYFGQLLLMGLSVWSYNLALSALGGIETGVDTVYIIFQILMVIAVCKVATRMDTFLQQLGVGVGVTGGGLADEVMGMAMAAGSMFKKAWGGLNGTGGEDGTGHRAEAVLGGVRGSDGVRPETVGAGFPGAVQSAWNRGMNAYERGASGKEVMQAAASGVKEGYGNPVGAIFGRGLQDKAKGIQDARKNAITRPPVTPDKTGGVIKSADGKTSHLTSQASANGLRINGKTGAVGGEIPAVGNFMAANMGKNDALDSIRATAKGGDPMASEHALFGTSNALGYDPNSSEVSPEEYDQEMSDTAFAAFAGGFNDLAKKAEDEGDDLSQEEKNLNAVGAAMRGTMEGDDSHGKLEHVQAKDMEGVKGGRVVTGDVTDAKGEKTGTFTALNEKGYESLSPAQKKGYVAMTSASGGLYYMRASGATVDTTGAARFARTGEVTPMGAQGTPVASPQPATTTAGAGMAAPTVQGGTTGVATATSGSTARPSFFTHNMGESVAASEYARENGVEVSDGVIRPAETAGEDFEGTGDTGAAATALNQAISLSETDRYYDDLVHGTVDSPECNRGMVYDALFSPASGDIGEGHDDVMAKMTDQTVGSDQVAQIAGSVQMDDAPVIPEESAVQMSAAFHAAVDGTASPTDDYRCENFASVDGVVGYDYVTPDGSYRVQIAEGGSDAFGDAPRATGESGGLSYDVSVAPIYRETVVDTFAPAAQTPLSHTDGGVAPQADGVAVPPTTESERLKEILGADYDPSDDTGKPKPKRRKKK